MPCDVDVQSKQAKVTSLRDRKAPRGNPLRSQLGGPHRNKPAEDDQPRARLEDPKLCKRIEQASKDPCSQANPSQHPQAPAIRREPFFMHDLS